MSQKKKEELPEKKILNPEENPELFEHHSFDVDAGQEVVRIDKFLMDRIANATRNKIQSAAKAGNIHVNDTAVKPNYRVKANDVITVVMAYPPRDKTIYPEDIPLDIVYEDEQSLAFRDIQPQAPTHLLIIPKKPIVTINEMEESDKTLFGHLFWVAKKIAAEMGFAEDGYRVVMNCNEHGGQSV